MATTPVIAWVRDPKDNQLAHGSYSLSTPTLGTRTGTLNTTGPSLSVEGVTCGEVVALTLTITGQPAPLTVYRRVPPSYASSPWRRPWLAASPIVPFDLGVQVGYFDPQEVGKDMATGSAGGASIAGAGSNVVVKDELGVWSLTKAQADAAHAAGAKLLWYGTPAPTAAEGVAYLDVVNGAVSTANKPVVQPPAVQDITVVYSGSSWSYTPAQIAAARGAGGKVTWAATTVPPTEANGLRNGDTVTGTFTSSTPAEPPAGISIPISQIPTANDLDGATADTVVLSRVRGVSWVVDGVTYPSGSMTEPTKSVPYTKGVNTVVMAVPETAAFKLIDVTTSWTLTFTDVVNNATTVTIDPAQYPVVTDNPGVTDDYVTLTSVADVTWTVGGVDYPSADFTGTRAVASYAGTTVTVTAKPARPGVTLAGTTSWSADFTNTGTPGTPMQMVSSSAFSTIAEGALPASPLVGAMDARYGGTVSDLSHNGNSKLTGYTGGGSLYLNGYGPSVAFMPADIIKTRGVEARIYSPQTGTKATGSRLELHRTTGNGVSLFFSNANVRVETFGTAWTTLSTLTDLGARDAVWFIGYDDATHKITVKKDGAVVYTGDYTYNGSAATAVKYTAESGSYSTTIDDVKVYSA